MPRYTIPYSLIDVPPTEAFPTRTKTPRPVLPVVLMNGGRWWACYAIVDSGADDCVFPYSFGVQIGLKMPTGRRYAFSGVGSFQSAYFFDIELAIPNVIGYTVSVGFTSGLESAGVGLLGQHGFFDRFKVEFDLPNGQFIIETR